MNIMELGAIGELVGGVAVVASLLFVGFQVRQSNRLTRAHVHQETSSTSSDLSMRMTREDVKLIFQGGTDLESLSDVDRVLFLLRFTAAVNYYETFFYARERREVDDELWSSRVNRMRNTFAISAPLWPTQKSSFGRRFADFVDAEIVPKLNRGTLVSPNGIHPEGEA